MNNSNESPLIDESEIRDALRVMQTDREAFERQVQERIARRLAEPAESKPHLDSEHLQVAASYMPWPVLVVPPFRSQKFQPDQS